MKRELKELEAKIKALRSIMEYWECFQPNDDVAQALAEVEAELDKFRWK